MKSINSEERFGRVSVGTGEAPTHTDEDHRRCAYYLTSSVIDQSPGGNETLICQHGVEPGGSRGIGAFYSEDYVRQMRELAQEFLGEVDGLIRNHPNPILLMPSIDRFREYFQ